MVSLRANLQKRRAANLVLNPQANPRVRKALKPEMLMVPDIWEVEVQTPTQIQISAVMTNRANVVIPTLELRKI